MTGEAPLGRSRFTPLTVGELAQLPPPQWLVEGLIPAGGLVLLFSEPGVGKSLLALDLALSLAEAHSSWFGLRLDPDRPVRQRPFVVCAVGEGLRSLSSRIEAWRSRAPGAVLDRLLIVPDVPSLAQPAECSAFLEAIVGAGVVAPRLLVFDTLARGTVGRDENSVDEASVTVTALDYLRAELEDTTLLVLHHAGWVKGRERGSSAFRAAADAVLGLERDEGSGLVMLRTYKQRDGAVGAPLTFRLTPAPPAVVFDLVDPEPALRPAVPLADRVLAAIGTEPGISQRRLLSRVGGRTDGTLNALKALLAGGVVEDRGDRRGSALFVTTPGAVPSPKTAPGNAPPLPTQLLLETEGIARVTPDGNGGVTNADLAGKRPRVTPPVIHASPLGNAGYRPGNAHLETGALPAPPPKGGGGAVTHCPRVAETDEEIERSGIAAEGCEP